MKKFGKTTQTVEKVIIIWYNIQKMMMNGGLQ